MGCGGVGSDLTVQLAEGGHNVSIIDKREEAFHRLPPGFDAQTVVGLGFDRDVLEDAGIKEAEAFVAVSSGDNSNIVSARVALEYYHVPKVIARIYDPRRADIYERLNIPTVATTKWGVKQIKYLGLFGAPEGIKKLSEAHPDVEVHLCAVDAHLNDRGYIVPGMGDAGDRQFSGE